MDYKTLKSEIRDNIAYITLNRPERLNSFDMKLGEELYKALHEISVKKEIRAARGGTRKAKRAARKMPASRNTHQLIFVW